MAWRVSLSKIGRWKVEDAMRENYLTRLYAMGPHVVRLFPNIASPDRRGIATVYSSRRGTPIVVGECNKSTINTDGEVINDKESDVRMLQRTCFSIP
jgi:hypothetical protein